MAGYLPVEMLNGSITLDDRMTNEWEAKLSMFLQPAEWVNINMYIIHGPD